MQKVKANALWNELTADQLKALDRWLFEEKMSLADAWAKAKAQLGFAGSVSSLKRYFKRRRREQTAVDFKELRDRVADVSVAPTDAALLQSASMKLFGRFLFEQMQQSPEQAKELAAVAGLMVQNERNEVRREWLKFARERFEFDTMKKALEALPQTLKLAEAKKDPHTKRFEENARWNLLRRRMFGAGIEIAPENAEEEAAMKAAKKEREERRAKEAQMEQEKITKAQPPPPNSPYYPEYIEKMAKEELRDWKPGAEYEI